MSPCRVAAVGDSGVLEEVGVQHTVRGSEQQRTELGGARALIPPQLRSYNLLHMRQQTGTPVCCAATRCHTATGGSNIAALMQTELSECRPEWLSLLLATTSVYSKFKARTRARRYASASRHCALLFASPSCAINNLRAGLCELLSWPRPSSLQRSSATRIACVAFPIRKCRSCSRQGIL